MYLSAYFFAKAEAGVLTIPSIALPLKCVMVAAMLLARYKTIAHRAHDVAHPVSLAKIDKLLGLCELEKGGRVVELGCGKAEVLIRLVERNHVIAEGVDTAAQFLAEARARAERRVPHASLTLHEGDAATYPLAPSTYDAALCISASHALGGLAPTLRAFLSTVRPFGWIVVGHHYLRKEPDAAYLAALDLRREDLTTHAENVHAGVVMGLVPIFAACASEDELDDYEWRFASSVESFAMAHPHDPEVPEMLDRVRAHRTAYLRYGRDTLGFGLYLFRRPGLDV